MTTLSPCLRMLFRSRRRRGVRQPVTATVVLIALLIIGSGAMSAPALAGPGAVHSMANNLADYPGGQVPKYEKFEVTFQANTTATNVLYPYDPSPPPGIQPGTGVTVTGEFSQDGFATVYRQPAFYYQAFDAQKKSGADWLYPQATFGWKVRFAPAKEGRWRYRITVQDSTGTSTSAPGTFTVVANPANHGFVRVSPKDARYFEFDDGTYFPGLGYNMGFDQPNPSGNEPSFQVMHANGIQLVRTWLSSWSIYGASWGRWYSHNPAHIVNEPQTSLTTKVNAQFGEYPGIQPPAPVDGNDYYLWLNADERVFPDGKQWRFNPCRVMGWNSPDLPVKRNSTYRLKVRYSEQLVEGPRVSRKPVGFVVKEGAAPLWDAADVTKRCYHPGTGTVLAATYPAPSGKAWTTYSDAQHPQWRILEASFNSGDRDFIDYLYLALENAKSGAADASAGHVFVDQLSIEEDLGGGAFGPNIVYKGSMNPHLSVNQRDAAAFDKVLDLARQYGIYIKAVGLEKNDATFGYLNHDGTLSPVRDAGLFYGNGREVTGRTKVRFLQQAWWRYMQARWGWSPNIHSWELLNEGPQGPADGPHWVLADVFGKYMKCGVFGVDPGPDCTYVHPNAHMVTTSFDQGFPYHFWNNTSGNYPDLDYADQHYYILESDPNFYDSALATESLSLQRGAKQPGGVRKPVMRGELGWTFPTGGADVLGQNADRGLWLHNLLWAGLNPGGLFEQYWGNPPWSHHVVKPGSHDHRDEFGRLYGFVKDIPLSNGNYADAAAVATDPNVRVAGQKDAVAGRAHLWVGNRTHTWCSVVAGVPGCPASWDGSRLNGTVTIAGFVPGKAYPVEWWQFDHAGTLGKAASSVVANGSGAVVLDLGALPSTVADAGVKLGDYSVNTAPE